MLSMADYLRGKNTIDLPDEILIFLLASKTGWSLREIMQLSKKDFFIYAGLARISTTLDLEQSKNK
jgi:hypothetical protein